jgi:hypothetical protein
MFTVKLKYGIQFLCFCFLTYVVAMESETRNLDHIGGGRQQAMVSVLLPPLPPTPQKQTET